MAENTHQIVYTRKKLRLSLSLCLVSLPPPHLLPLCLSLCLSLSLILCRSLALAFSSHNLVDHRRPLSCHPYGTQTELLLAVSSGIFHTTGALCTRVARRRRRLLTLPALASHSDDPQKQHGSLSNGHPPFLGGGWGIDQVAYIRRSIVNCAKIEVTYLMLREEVTFVLLFTERERESVSLLATRGEVWSAMIGCAFALLRATACSGG